jgi:hypothetical protein
MASGEQYTAGKSEAIDLERPHAARIYDYLLGGTANWAIDRVFVGEALEVFPSLKPVARANYDFIGRAVRYCARNGISQFLDLGSGVPKDNIGMVHEVAGKIEPTTRCVYVDVEPVAVNRFQMFLDKQGDPALQAAISADLRNVSETWRRAIRTGLLRPDEPIGLILGAVLHFLPLEFDAHAVVEQYRELLPVGSYLVISHVTEENVPEPERTQVDKVRSLYRKSSTPIYFRSHEEVRRFFGDFTLTPPGSSWLPEWQMDKKYSPETAAFLTEPERSCLVGGVAIKTN